jgi:hypothetical protein
LNTIHKKMIYAALTSNNQDWSSVLWLGQRNILPPSSGRNHFFLHPFQFNSHITSSHVMLYDLHHQWDIK